jgi:hypothetical protein
MLGQVGDLALGRIDDATNQGGKGGQSVAQS